jgi:hypothetical protein
MVDFWAFGHLSKCPMLGYFKTGLLTGKGLAVEDPGALPSPTTAPVATNHRLRGLWPALRGFNVMDLFCH